MLVLLLPAVLLLNLMVTAAPTHRCCCCCCCRNELELLQRFLEMRMIAHALKKPGSRRGKHRRPSTIESLLRRWFAGRQTTAAAAGRAEVLNGVLDDVGNQQELIGTAGEKTTRPPARFTLTFTRCQCPAAIPSDLEISRLTPAAVVVTCSAARDRPEWGAPPHGPGRHRRAAGRVHKGRILRPGPQTRPAKEERVSRVKTAVRR